MPSNQCSGLGGGTSVEPNEIQIKPRMRIYLRHQWARAGNNSQGEHLSNDNKDHNWIFHIVQHPKNFHPAWLSFNPGNLCYEKTFMAVIPHHTSFFYSCFVHTCVHRGAAFPAHREAAPAFVPAPHLPTSHQGVDRARAAGDNPDQLLTGTVTSPKLKTAKACWWEV